MLLLHEGGAASDDCFSSPMDISNLISNPKYISFNDGQSIMDLYCWARCLGQIKSVHQNVTDNGEQYSVCIYITNLYFHPRGRASPDGLRL
jgi:hypothetical protein